MIKEHIIKLGDEIKELIDSWNEWIDKEKYETLLNQILPKSFENMSEEKMKEVFNNLMMLKNGVIKYDKYLVADKNIELDMDDINLEYIEKEVVMICANKILKILSQIETDQINIQKSESLVSHFYYIAYQLMKKEFLFDNDSIIYKYIKEFGGRKKIMESFIREDYEIIKQLILNSDFDDKKICEILFSIDFDKKGNLLDERLIRLIAQFDITNKKHIENVNRDFDNCIMTIKEKARDIENNIKSEKSHYDSLGRLIEEQIKDKKMLKLRIGSIVLTMSIFCGYFLGNSSLAKKNSNYKYYNGSVSSYSSYDDELKTEQKRYKYDSQEENYTLLKVYSKTYSEGLFDLCTKRTVSTYDVTGLDLSNYEDYFNLNLNDLDYDIKEIDYTDEVPASEYKEVIKTNIDKSEVFEDVDDSSYYMYQFTNILIIELLCDVISFICSKRKNSSNNVLPGMIYNLKKIFGTDKDRFVSLYSYLRNYDKKIKSHEKELQYLDDAINFLLKEYNDANSNLNRMRHEYGYSINDECSRYQEIERLNQDIKMKVLNRKED